MSRSTKLVVIVSNLCALWLTATLVSRGIPSILGPTAAAFAASVLCALVFGDFVTSVILSTVYLVPAICFLWYNTFVFSYYAIWLAGLCGSLLPKIAGSEWAYPTRLRSPLVLWALTVALSWPLIVLREVDFVPWLLSVAGMNASRFPQSPAIIAVWVSNVASIVLTGLLLLDWLLLVYSGPLRRNLESRVILPIFAGAVPAAAVAVYQSLVDMSFMNHSLFESLGRAVGTMRDANAFGVAMALWLPFAAAKVGDAAGHRLVAMVWSAILIVLGIAIWGSGSRTAFLAAAVGLAVLMFDARRWLGARRLVGAALVAALCCAAIVWLVPSTTWTRARAMVPGFSIKGAVSVMDQLWSRGMYGTAAVVMIKEHPLVGVGLGGFNYQYGDVLARMGVELKPDNAQNWFRQQIAELGIVGSIGWILWLLLFLVVLVRCPDAEGSGLKISAAKGGIVGLASASLLGMPTQDAAASITFVVIVSWCLSLKAECAFLKRPAIGRSTMLEWGVMLGVLVSFLSGTAYAARNELRPVSRAARSGFPYRYGFTVDSSDSTIRWTGRKAVELITADKRWLKVELGQVAPDAEANPVPVSVSIDKTLILRVSRRSNFPLVRWVRMPPYGTPLTVQIEVERTWRPSDFGRSSDTNERGVTVREWVFTDEDPPKGSVTIESLQLLPR
jgi:O-Antigen ligase